MVDKKQGSNIEADDIFDPLESNTVEVVTSAKQKIKLSDVKKAVP